MSDNESSESAEVSKRVDDMIGDVSAGRVGKPNLKKLRDACDEKINPKPAAPTIFDAIRNSQRGRLSWPRSSVQTLL